MGHGRGSSKALASKRVQKQKVGYTYLHSIIDGFSRWSYTEALEDETAATTIGFFHRARAHFAAHGITRITRLVTDNGSNDTATAFQRSIKAFIGHHQRTRHYTSENNDAKQSKSGTATCNYHRPHTTCGDQPPASRLRIRVDNVMTNYTEGTLCSTECHATARGSHAVHRLHN